MATNPLGAVKLPAYVTDPKKRAASLTPPTPPPAGPPPPVAPTIDEMAERTRSGLPGTARKTMQFLRATPGEQQEMLPPAVQAVGRGAVAGMSEMATPQNLLSLAALTAATAFAPPVVMGLLAIGFTVSAIHDLSKKVPEATEAFRRGDVEEGTRLLTLAVPDLAMAVPSLRAGASLARRGIEALPKVQLMGQPLSAEGGFVTLTFKGGRGQPAGQRDIVGSEVIGHEEAPGIEPYTAQVHVRKPPTTRTEIPLALASIEQQGIDPRTAVFRIGDETMNIEGAARRYPEIAEWLRLYTPPSPAGPPPTPATTPVVRTPGGRRTTVTDPMKLQRQQELQQQSIERKLDINAALQAEKPPTPTHITKGGQVKQPRTPMEPVPEPAAEPQQVIPGSALERAIVAMMEHNRLLSEQLRVLTERTLGAAPAAAPTPAVTPAEVKAVIPKVPKKAAAAVAATPMGDLATQIQEAIKEAPQVELAPGELRGMGAKGKGKKEPVSYVGKTMEEKYAPTEPAAQPEAVKAAATPASLAELNTALEAFNKGEGRPIYIVRRGLGGAKPTRGVILGNIAHARTGKPTEFYTYMPDNWTGDPFSIHIKDIQPVPMGRTHEMNVPRHAQRTYDLGMEVAVPRKPDIVKGQRVRLPDGALGTHVDDVVGGKNIIKYFMKNLEEAAKGGDPTAQARYTLFKSKLESKGYPTLARVAMDDGRWIDFAPEELTPVEAGKVTTTQPSKQIKPVTAAAEAAAAKGISAAKIVTKQMEVPRTKEEIAKGEKPTTRTITGVETPAAKPIPPPPGPPEPGQPVQRQVTKEEVKKEARVSKPTETFKGQRKKELALEEAQRKRMEYKPGVIEAKKPTPPPSITPARVVEEKAPEAADTLTRVLARREQELAKLKEELPEMESREKKAGFRLKEVTSHRNLIKEFEDRVARLKERIQQSAPPIPPPPKK